MNRSLPVFLLFTLVFWPAYAGEWRTESAAAIAQRFFPASVAKGGLTAEIGGEPGELSAAASFYSIPGSHERSVIAAYASFSNGGVRLLRRRGNDWFVAAGWAIDDFVTSPAITFTDLDSDDVPEVLITFAMGAKAIEATYVFQWRDGGLHSMGDVENGALSTGIFLADVVDVDGDGNSELVEARMVEREDDATGEPGGDPHRTTYHLYRQSGGRFIPAGAMPFFESFVLDEKRPVDATRTFESLSPQGRYDLAVVRVGDGGERPLKDVRLVLNGTTITDSLTFSPGSTVLHFPVALLPSNQLSVVIRASEPSSHVQVDDGRHPTLVVVVQPDL